MRISLTVCRSGDISYASTQGKESFLLPLTFHTEIRSIGSPLSNAGYADYPSSIHCHFLEPAYLSSCRNSMLSFGLIALQVLAAGALPDRFDTRDFQQPRQSEADVQEGGGGGGGGGCPAVWREIRANLWPRFAGCSRGASFAIRFAFHDAGTYQISSFAVCYMNAD